MTFADDESHGSEPSEHVNETHPPRLIPVIGIVGGIASGKSLVAQQFGELGAVLLDGDRFGHEALCLPEIETGVRQRWGGEVFDDEGRVDRAALAEIVFAPGAEAELEYLEQLTHPRIEAQLRREISELAGREGVPAVVLDAAVMFEAGWDRLCDSIVFVDTPHDLRCERAMRRGWTKEDLAAREAAQRPLADKTPAGGHSY